MRRTHPVNWGDDGEPVYAVESPEPGSDWERIRCVDCLRVSNENRRRREREQLQRITLELCARLTDGTARLGDSDISATLETIRKLLS